MTAVKSQLVCGESCRLKRRRKLARRRREAELDRYRVEERQRQRECREALREAGCHAPPSSRNRRESRAKSVQLWNELIEVSRATFERQLRRIVRIYGPLLGQEEGGEAHCHAPPRSCNSRLS